MSDLTLSDAEIRELTGYKTASKALNVLHSRGFVRAYINRSGRVILERAHYEAVTRGELHQPRKAANLTFLKSA